MQYIYNAISLKHNTGDHPECAARLSAFVAIEQAELPDAEAYLSLVHSPEHIQNIKDCAKEGRDIDGDTLTCPDSYKAAVAAVSAAIMASEQNGFSLMRPPGHHAYAEKASGFCLFNGIAVAAQKLVSEGKKVLLFDFDGHLGDGTSDIFYESDQVLYLSFHQSPAFPYKGMPYETGKGKGKGYTWNLNLPAGSSDDVFLDALNTFLPLAEAFQPDVVGISAGFDGHYSDPLLQLNFSLNSFYRAGILLSEKFPSLFAVLEGGYNLDYLPKCIESFKAGVNGQEKPHKEAKTISEPSVYEQYEIAKSDLLSYLKK